jgi:hypothetical protein
LGDYKGKWVIMIGFKAEDLNRIAPIVQELSEMYPDQEYNIGNSRFPQYDFILFCFADGRDQAHQIGTALVRKHLPSDLKLLYWVKEKNLLKYNVKEE